LGVGDAPGEGSIPSVSLLLRLSLGAENQVRFLVESHLNKRV
jgi:hypothetical protein